MYYKYSRKELKNKKASSFKNLDTIEVGNYLITIKYGKYNRPLCSYVENLKTYQMLKCTPGVRGGRPYYINDFLGE